MSTRRCSTCGEYLNAIMEPVPVGVTLPIEHRPAHFDIGINARGLYDAKGVYLGTVLNEAFADLIVFAVNATAKE